jgi:hypothetical protein
MPATFLAGPQRSGRARSRMFSTMLGKSSDTLPHRLLCSNSFCVYCKKLHCFTASLLTSAQQHLEMLARGCNTFRSTCLETCDLGNIYFKCMKNCKELYGKFPNYREHCEETCEERSCGNECRDIACCIGPEQCREGREADRCTK